MTTMQKEEDLFNCHFQESSPQRGAEAAARADGHNSGCAGQELTMQNSLRGATYGTASQDI